MEQAMEAVKNGMSLRKAAALFSVGKSSLHRYIHHGVPSHRDRVYYCPGCGTSHRHKKNLLRHLAIECGKEPAFRCGYCDHRSKRKGNVVAHVKRRHPGLDVKWLCEQDDNITSLHHLVE